MKRTGKGWKKRSREGNKKKKMLREPGGEILVDKVI